MNKKAISMTWETIITIILALVVLVFLLYLVYSGIKPAGEQLINIGEGYT